MIENWYEFEEAQKCRQVAGNDPADQELGERAYTSRLIGQNPDLVMHGGGNTSVKVVRPDLFGRMQRILHVKGSGWDLDVIEAPGLPGVRLEPLLELRRLDALSDEEMVNLQRCNLLDSTSPNPSVETLLHAFLPHTYVDHTHATPFLVLANLPNAEGVCREIFGGRLGIVPYIMPGFGLAKKAAEFYEKDPEVEGLLLLNHGHFAFGATARESYDRIVRHTNEVAGFFGMKKPTPLRVRRPADDLSVLPILRGAIAEETGTPDSAMPVFNLRNGENILAFFERSDVETLSTRGMASPDHVLRTKGRPLVLRKETWSGGRESIRAEVSKFSTEYRAYFVPVQKGHKSFHINRLWPVLGCEDWPQAYNSRQNSGEIGRMGGIFAMGRSFRRSRDEGEGMRTIREPLVRLGEIAIEDIEIDAVCRDDIPAVLRGIQHLYCNEELRQQVFDLLDAHFLPGVDRGLGRPGMDLWRIFVLATLKQGIRCDYDRLQDLANRHGTVREMLGHSGLDDHHRYEHRTLVRNVSLLTPELLNKINELVVKAGHALFGQEPEAPLRARADSFVVETDVHYPTDVNLLWDAMRCLIRVCAELASAFGLGGWRQSRHLRRQVKRLFNKIRNSRRQRRHPDRVRVYLELCRSLVARAERLRRELEAAGAEAWDIDTVQGLMDHALRQIDQIDRRLLQGEVIPHEEKVFSIFEPHTRWCAKGKAGRLVELGVPVCIVEDQHKFVLHHRILWEDDDVDAAVPLLSETLALFPSVRGCSFDRGFHSPSNRVRLDALLECNALPAKGTLSQKAREREARPEFAAARRQHPAVESAIHNLECRGLDRVRAHGRDGFARTVALAILAANLHRIGLALQRAERDKIRNQRRQGIRRAA